MAETWEWVDHDGTATRLPVLHGATGRRGPVTNLQTSITPGVPGEQLEYASHLPLIVTLPLYWTGPTKDADMRALMSAMNASKGPGLLRLTAGDGVQRELSAVYHEGLGAAGDVWSTWNTDVLIFEALRPYWRDTTETVFTFSLDAPKLFFPIPLVELNNSQIVGSDVAVVNDGDVDAWPVWVITGPGDGLILAHSSGHTLDLSGGTLAAGDVLTVDTSPTAKTVRLATGQNRFDLVQGRPDLWAIPDGLSTVNVSYASTTVDSLIELRYRREWLSA